MIIAFIQWLFYLTFSQVIPLQKNCTRESSLAKTEQISSTGKNDGVRIRQGMAIERQECFCIPTLEYSHKSPAFDLGVSHKKKQ